MDFKMHTGKFLLFFFLSWNQLMGQSLPVPMVSLDPKTISNSDELLNFNPVYSFGGAIEDTVSVILEKEPSQLTIFTVFRSEHENHEQTVWSLCKPEYEELLTNMRLVDFEGGKILNYQLKDPRNTHFNHYFRQKKIEGTGAFRFTLGGYGGKREYIPASPFRGVIGETMVFDQVLSRKERQIISTYYALKYGLALSHSQDSSYLNGWGEPIWDEEKNDSFDFHITGVGRDDLTGLYQKQSTSSYAPDLFTLSLGTVAESNEANSASIPDGAYLLWGDNDKGLTFGPTSGLGKTTERQWALESSGPAIGQPITIRVNQRRWLQPLMEGEKLWLMLDQSGTGNFSAEDTKFFSAKDIASNGRITFSDIEFPANSRQILTFSAGPEIMPVYWSDSLLCHPDWDGTLTVGVVGGMGPFNLKLLNSEGVLITSWQGEGNDYREITGLEDATYELEIEDSNGYFTRRKVDGCVSEKEAFATSTIASYHLGPNPTLDGDFILTLRLRESGPVRLSISDSSGRVIHTESVDGDYYYSMPGVLPVSGTYFIRIQTGEEEITLPIIRQ
jgi:hypothetical protein